MTAGGENTGPLKGVRVFDMTRILAGPSATQVLGDLGADILKIEKPNEGDDTRKWGPPYLKNAAQEDTTESSYYLSANRNKRSLSLDFTKPEGLAVAKKLIARCDVLFENYKTGTLDKYGLGYEQLKKEFPRLIYCSLTGFGHSGPSKNLGGYDFLIQGMGGIMSLTGPTEGEPYKIAVAYTDLLTGLYALNGILAALYHREKTGKGQFIDIALMDTQVAALSYGGQYYLTTGQTPPRMGNAHATIVPYETFMAKDGYLILAIGNDRQFADFCAVANRPELSSDPRFAKNSNRVKNRAEIVAIVRDIIAEHPLEYWTRSLEQRGVPCGPVNSVDKVFADKQVQARGMVAEMPHPAAPSGVKLIASPLRFSDTPVSYRHAPPMLGEDTDEILTTELAMTAADISNLRNLGVV
jgi:crotonobetainyl-CoA:carnitine CoA-transferase CaiB-like acyl-CoA transferase